MGTPDFAVPSLRILLEHNYLIPAVVTAPDKPRGRGQTVTPTPIKSLAVASGLPVIEPDSLNDPAFVQQLRDLAPDLIIVVAFRILPQEVFSIPRWGSFNLHASLLPKYRGAAPINRAIMNGERETGVTTFFLRERVDTGNIILQARIPIRHEDDAGTIHDKLAEVGAGVVLHTVRLIEQGMVKPTNQDDSLATPAPKIFKNDCRINWNRSAGQVHNQIRGLSPYPAAFTSHAGKTIKIFKSMTKDELAGGNPGRLVVSPTTIQVETADSMLAILELQQEGKKRMTAEEFLRGYKLSTGETFN